MVWQQVTRSSKLAKLQSGWLPASEEVRLAFEGCGRTKCVGERLVPDRATAASLAKGRLADLREQFPTLELVLEEKRFLGPGGKPSDCHLLTATGTDVDQIKFCLNLAVDRNFRLSAQTQHTQVLEIPEESRKFVGSFLKEAEQITGAQLRLVKAGVEISGVETEIVEDARLCVSVRLQYFRLQSPVAATAVATLPSPV